MNRQAKFVTGILVAALAAAALYITIRPSAIPVEVDTVTAGTLEVTVEAQGETRSHDRFVIAAPVSGRLLRTLHHDGDAVAKNDVVAVLEPVPLSAREREELDARAVGAAATQRAAQAALDHAIADLAQARRERTRMAQLADRGLVARQLLEQADNAADTLERDVEAARSRAEAAAASLREARAALTAGANASRSAMQLRSPGAGRILRILEVSERVLSTGTPIMVIGDVGRLEAVLEMLSSDALKVTAGMPATIDSGAGNTTLRAQVRVVEPYAFTKVSTLGVEEKRTNVVLQFVDAPGSLGDGYRLVGRVLVWQGHDVLRVPVSALFRCDDKWCVFVQDGNRVRRRQVDVGHLNDTVGEVLSGLLAGERVVRHPPNELRDGARVVPR